MYAIIDFMLWAFVRTEGEGIITFEMEDDADQYAEENLQTGLFRVIRVPDAGMGFKP